MMTIVFWLVFMTLNVALVVLVAKLLLAGLLATARMNAPVIVDAGMESGESPAGAMASQRR